MDPTNIVTNQVFFTGVNVRFWEGYAATQVWWNQVAMEMPSKTSLETYGWMDRLPVFEEWRGPRTVHAIPTRSRSVVNKKWQDSVALPRPNYEDDQFGLFMPAVSDLGRQGRKLHDQQLALLLEANPIGFDGLTFFNTAHLQDIDNPASPTQSNDLQTLPLNASNYGAARAQMRGWKGRDGQPLSYGKTLLVVPPALEEPARQLNLAQSFAPQQFGNLANNVGATDNIWRGMVGEPLVIEELTKPKVWYLLRTDMTIKPLLVQKRKEITFVPKVSPSDDNVFWNDELVWGADGRFAYDVTLWWLALRCGASL